MAKNDNLKDYLTDLADAIREKEGSSEPINPQDFSNRIRAIQGGGSGWTGHADVEGLKAIGWTDEDIEYYQAHGVNWNAEDDDLHKVPQFNIDLYGKVTATNIGTYKTRIVYLPKIDTSAETSLASFCENCNSMVAIPFIDTSNVTDMNKAFSGCYSLLYLPPLDTGKVTNMSRMLYNCRSLLEFEFSDTSNVTDMSTMFYGLTITHLPPMDTHNVVMMDTFINACYSLTATGELDFRNVTSVTTPFVGCSSLRYLMLKNLNTSFEMKNSHLLEKDSLLYIINNEAATSPITITLATYAYSRLSKDADVVAALENHPNVSISNQ